MGTTKYIMSMGELSRKDNSLCFRKDGKNVHIPVENTKEIYCFNEVSINSKLLGFLAQNNIIVHFFNYYGGYSGTYYPRDHYLSGKLIVKQALKYQNDRMDIARAIVNEPRVLLLDEPLGALDLKLRQDMQYELIRLKNELGITFIYVTHDQEEALTMSDKIVVLSEGKIQQIGTPEDIYNEPQNAFVADFIGESNILNGMMVKDLLVEINGHRFECVDTGFGENKPVDVVIRPEDIQLVKPDDSHISGVVQSVTFKGVHYEMLIEAYDHDWLVHSTKAAEVGSTVGIKFDPYDIHIMHKMND